MTVELNPVTSGYSTNVINDNFQKVEDWVNLNALWRQGVELGQANQMEAPLDMNSNPILNIGFDPDNPDSLLDMGVADLRYVNLTGDTMQGSLNMSSYPLFVRIAINDEEPIRKGTFDQEVVDRQAADSNLQSQMTGNVPLEASAFSPISWHDQSIENSVTIPANKNAWSFGPTITIASGQAVTVGENSYWTIASGQAVESGTFTGYDEGTL